MERCLATCVLISEATSSIVGAANARMISVRGTWVLLRIARASLQGGGICSLPPGEGIYAALAAASAEATLRNLSSTIDTKRE
eukprot:CAMPEP_0179933116 /NCGR_PEP_ID=MMETSP0983-20121128/11671_1 /TAXON_ID=483367 /ORGANISM="non described non described, Strain CCMP 2436" /LENGTH=82 /DNA_ID=CAMNT_0021837849 /DNA_START=477 /DNA_END=725 /DNA_ORIENTATION=-